MKADGVVEIRSVQMYNIRYNPFVGDCLIETNSFLIGEFMFILNADWMGRNNLMSMLISHIYK